MVTVREAIIVVAIGTCVITFAVMPILLNMVGFGRSGIRRGSYAASMMSKTACVGNRTGLVPSLQSIGMNTMYYYTQIQQSYILNIGSNMWVYVICILLMAYII